MAKWNDIPLSENTPAEELADQFEKQWEENGGNGEPEDNNPYSKENFGK